MTEEWAPTGIDTARPSPARIYDWLLGGKDNFAADRKAGERILKAAPHSVIAARENRAFLRRVVEYLASQGVDQFLDIGTGLPTRDNVHEVAQRRRPQSRVVYVDNDPIVSVHGRALLSGTDHVALVQADLREPETILADEHVRKLIDLSRPVAILLLAILHFVPDGDDPHALLARLLADAAPGSFLVVTHATADLAPPELSRQVEQVYKGASASLHTRTRDDVARMFTGTELVEPGLVFTSQWRPDPGADAVDPRDAALYAAVGRKP